MESPGFLASTAFWSPAPVVIAWPSTSAMTSPPVGKPLAVDRRAARRRPEPRLGRGGPLLAHVGQLDADRHAEFSATELLIVATPTPRQACSTEPSAMICVTIVSMVLDGTAKPMPSLPPIRSRSARVDADDLAGPVHERPPELPWLMAASV